MGKMPQDIPTKKDQQVVRRGSAVVGTVRKIDNNWVWIDWNGIGPKICHAFELKIVETPENGREAR